MSWNYGERLFARISVSRLGVWRIHVSCTSVLCCNDSPSRTILFSLAFHRGPSNINFLKSLKNIRFLEICTTKMFFEVKKAFSIFEIAVLKWQAGTHFRPGRRTARPSWDHKTLLNFKQIIGRSNPVSGCMPLFAQLSFQDGI